MAEPSRVGAFLRARRDELRLGRAEVASRAGVKERLLEAWETGETQSLPLEESVRVARVMQIDPREFQAVVLGTPLTVSAATGRDALGNGSGDGDLDEIAQAVQEAAERIERLRRSRRGRQRPQ